MENPANDQRDSASAESPAESEAPAVALSLDELGRAYAKAVGVEPGPAEPPEVNNLAENDPQHEENVCPISPKSIVEAILFVGAPEHQVLTARQIASWLRGVSPKEVLQIVRELNEIYEHRDAPYRIEIDKSQLQMVLAPPYEPVREKFYGEIPTATLSQAAVDVLAIVAYNQPVTLAAIQRLRGRQCRAILRQLERRQLVASSESSESEQGREYRTTERFLTLFGLESLDDLPQAHELPADVGM